METHESGVPGLGGKSGFLGAEESEGVKHVYVRDRTTLHLLPEGHPLAQSGDIISPRVLHENLRRQTREAIRTSAINSLGGSAISTSAEISPAVQQEL